MKLNKTVSTLVFGVLVLLMVSGCGSSGSGGNSGDGGSGNNETLVTIRGRADDGTATSPIANAQCRFMSRNGSQLATATADSNGEFQFAMLPNTQGIMECTPPGFPNLSLMTFVSTAGTAPGETVPAQGSEEVSPRTTVITTMLLQTAPPDPQARKTELLAALAAQDPDLTMLVAAATELFNTMLQQQITEVDFSSSGEDSDDAEGGSGGGGAGGGGSDAGGGVAGDAGDGTEFSPLANAQCEFVLDPQGDTALENLLLDGSLDSDRPELQAIAADVQQAVNIREAFVKFFPQGIQPLVNGQPLRMTANAAGEYFLPVPPGTSGFVRCAAGPQLAVATFVRARQVGEILTGQTVSPSSHVFTEFIFPQLPTPLVPAVETNFLTDIGDLQVASAGIVRLETVATPQGRMIADTDGDGLVCSLLISDPQEGSIQYVDAGATAYTAIALYKTLLIESKNPATASYDAILTDVLTRTDQTGSPRVEVLAEDLLAGGVPVGRAMELAPRLNACLRFGVESVLGTTLPRMVRTGRFRVTVRDATGAPVSRARVGGRGMDGRGRITAASECRDTQGQTVTPIARETNLIVCSADDNGSITFILEGEESLAATPVAWSVRSSDDARLLGVVNAPFVPAVTLDAPVTVPAP